MSTTRDDLREWFKEGLDKDATHMLIVCDTFSYEDYPCFVSSDQDLKKVETKYDNKNMQKVMEIYNLNMDMEEQLNNKHRVYNR